MDMGAIIARVRDIPECTIYPVSGIPSIQKEHLLPDDLKEFYQLCGGMDLFPVETQLPAYIMAPEKVVLANPVLVEGLTKEAHPESADDISWSWYIIVRTHGYNYITIDLSPNRLGRCYESFAFTHGVPGDCPIIAFSFTDLLIGLLENEGTREYWKEPDFKYLGDAYDGL